MKKKKKKKKKKKQYKDVTLTRVTNELVV